MTDQDTSNGEERFVDVKPSFVADAQSAELVEPTDRAFDDPAKHAQAATVIGSLFGNLRLGAHFAQRLTVGFGIIRAVGVKLI